MKRIFQTTIWLALLGLIVACDSSDDTRESQNAVESKLLHPEIDYQYELHGITLENKYHWLTNAEDELSSQWKQAQENNLSQYFEQYDYDDFSENIQFDRTENYTLTQKIGQHYFMVKQPYFNNKPWSLDIYNSLTSNIESFDINSNNGDTITALSVSISGRYAGLLYKNTNNYQWRIYDTFAGQFKNSLPWLDYPSNLLWHSATEYIYTNKAEVNLADVRRAKLKTLFALADHLEDAVDWSKLNFQLTHKPAQFYISSRHLSSNLNKGWLVNIDDIKNIQQQELISKVKADLKFVGSRKDLYYFATDLAAPRNRVIAVNKDKPERRYWKEIIAQSSAVLIQAKLLQDQWLLFYRDNAQSLLKLSNLNGDNSKEISVPPYTELTLNDQSYYSNEYQNPLLNIQSLTKPARSFELENSKLLSVLNNSPDDQTFSLNSQLSFYRSSDGSRIPISIFSSGKNNKNKPLLLLVNNGFANNDNYHYSGLVKSFIQLGGSVAIAHIRGGATYGNSWVKAGSGANKTKAVQDILAAQEWLIDKNFTPANQLAIFGNELNSAIIAQSLNQTESKVGVAIFDEGYYNLVNYLQNNLGNKTILKEYGYENNKESLEQILQLSPFQNINKSNYPATLLISRDSNLDTLQYLSKLQNNQKKNQPMLITMTGTDSKEEKLKQTIFFLSKQLKL